MKIRAIKLFSVALLISSFFLTGCNDEFDASRPTYWPELTLTGDAFQIITVGDPYTDEGAVATINGAPVAYTTDGAVDPNTAGYYVITYSVANEDGVEATVKREVLVVDPAALADDLSGSYIRSATGAVSTWAKDPSQDYAYIANNPGGVASNPPFDVQFTIYNVAPGKVVVPLQQHGLLAPFYCSASLGGPLQIDFNVGATPGDLAYAWVVNGANFGTGLRSFYKQ